jgi:hypothetical protein
MIDIKNHAGYSVKSVGNGGNIGSDKALDKFLKAQILMVTAQYALLTT